MIGQQLKNILADRGISVNELSRRVGVSPQTLHSVLNRDTNRIDFDLLVKICAALSLPLELFYGDTQPAEKPAPEELALLEKYRALDEHGRQVTELVLDFEHRRVTDARQTAAPRPDRIIPLYATPAAAGYANPAFGEDYEDYAVPADSRADFAARIQGDSMEPYIDDGSIVLVNRSMPLTDGDVGLFFVDGDIKCKQYCEDSFGNIYLFSLNRARADADTTVPASSGITVFCFGKVLLDRRPPLPVR
jgi:phage repressor protein C with HTH and peptisase S24 domain/DNA-binding Xre family transcriptional regulator